jgi:UDP:flavonoid glycosyltransferase YjiC (YdhE family)
MQAVERKKAGVLLRASSVTEASLKAVVTVMATDKTYEKNALLLRDQFTRIDALQRFRSFVSEVLKPT